MSTFALLYSDSHAGHQLGLANPDTIVGTTDFREQIKVNSIQRDLWDWYANGIDWAMSMIGKSPFYLWHVGDLCHGDKHRDQLMSNRLSDQIGIAVSNIDFLYKMKNFRGSRFIVGTDAHEFGDASATILVAAQMSKAYPGKDTKAFFHMLIKNGSAAIDMAHHGPGQSSRSWLSGNTARYYLTDMVLRAIENGDAVPTMVLRGHVHSPIHETVSRMIGGKWRRSEIFVSAAMCMLSNYARQVTQSVSRVYNTMAVVELTKTGAQLVDIFVRYIDVRTIEELEL